MTSERRQEDVVYPVSTRCSNIDLTVPSEDRMAIDDDEDCRYRATTMTVAVDDDDDGRYQTTTTRDSCRLTNLSGQAAGRVSVADSR